MNPRKYAVSILLLGAFLLGVSKDINFPRLEEYTSRAMDAYRAGKHRLYLDNLIVANRIFPGHPRILYRLAGAYALNGRPREAQKSLLRLAAMGLVFPVEKEADLQPLHSRSEWAEIVRAFRVNAKPLMKASPAFFLKEKGLLTEGIAFDPSESRFYVSSVHRRKIIRCDGSGQAEDFSREADGLWAVMGMKVDANRRILWAASSAIPQMTGYKAEDEGRAGIFRYDLVSGALSGKFPLPGKPENHLIGDLAVAADGTVMATDSASPVIYSLSPGQGQLEVFQKKDSFQSLQGIDFSPDGIKVFVADYAAGVYAIDRKTRAATLLTGPEDAVLTGIDGLYFYQDSLLAIQNDLAPHRVIRIFLDKKWNEIVKVETLESSHPLFIEPTLGTVAGDAFFFIANSQWGMVDEKGNMAAEEKLQQPAVLRMILSQK